MIDWAHFSPVPALAGGVLIGVASGAMALLLGRIAGISGILGGVVQGGVAGDRAWRVLFLAGLLAAPWGYQIVAALPPIEVQASTWTLVAAGLLVGVGTRLGSGCTSGHGVCGLSRLSPRSLVATLAFMGSGFVTVYVLRHVLAA